MTRTLAGATRLGFILPLAGAATIALFILMQVLIRTDLAAIGEPEERVRITIAEYIPEERVVRTLDEPETETLEPPDYPVIDRERAVPEGFVETVSLGEIAVTPEVEGIEAGHVVIQREPAPLVRVEPGYPPRLLERGIEGTCLVRFDVLGSGRTANVSIVSCDRGFEQASLRAVREWRYSADADTGPNAVALSGLTTRLDYRFD